MVDKEIYSGKENFREIVRKVEVLGDGGENLSGEESILRKGVWEERGRGKVSWFVSFNVVVIFSLEEGILGRDCLVFCWRVNNFVSGLGWVYFFRRIFSYSDWSSMFGKVGFF